MATRTSFVKHCGCWSDRIMDAEVSSMIGAGQWLA